VRPESAHLETAARIQLAQPIECCRGEQVNGGAIEECVLWEVEIRSDHADRHHQYRLAHARQRDRAAGGV
jgi:hypothetical protein